MAHLEVIKNNNRLRIETQVGIWELGDNWENKKVLFIILRSYRDLRTGKPLFTFQEIADAFGYGDRRNIDNYWREFEKCGENFLDYLNRKRKVDRIVVAAVEGELKADIFSSIAELRDRTNKRLGRTDLSDSNIVAALEQIPGTVIRTELLSKWDKGKFQPKEEAILEEVMSALEGDDSSKKERALALLEKLEIESSENKSEEKLEEKVQNDQQASVEDLLTPGVDLAQIPEKVQMMVFAMRFYFWNIPFSQIGLLLGISKSTAYNWIIGLSTAIWLIVRHWLPQKVKASRVYIDEKWLKIKGKWHYWFVALDDETGLPILSELLRSRSKWACRLFLLKLKALGKIPAVIITDGLPGYVSAIAKVFSKCKHLLCIFHFTQNVTVWVKKHLKSLPAETVELIKKKMKKVVQTTDTRTVKRRLDKLESEDEENGWGISGWIKNIRKKLDKLIPSLRDNSYPKTTNPIERFFRAFNRFYKTRGGFHSVESAKREIIVFLVVYLFTIQVESGKAPIEAIIPSATEMPLFKLLNYPLKFGIKDTGHIPADFSDLEKMATEFVKKKA